MDQIYPYPYGVSPDQSCFYGAEYYRGIYSPIIPSQETLQKAVDYQYAQQVRQSAMMQQKNLELEMLANKFELEIRQEAIRKKIELAATDERDMHRSDLRAISAMQPSELEIVSDGRILYSRKGFESVAELKVPFQIPGVVLFRCENSDRSILSIGYVMGKRKGGVYIWTDKLDDRTVNRKFNESGLTCGLSKGKEANFRSLLIQQCIKLAHEKWVPPRHGWYWTKGEARFAFPEDFTWREVAGYAGK